MQSSGGLQIGEASKRPWAASTHLHRGRGPTPKARVITGAHTVSRTTVGVELKMHPKDKIDAAADNVSSFCRTEMASKQLGGTRNNILLLDGRGDYLLLKKQMKSKLRSMGLANVLQDKSLHIIDIDGRDSQEQAVYIVMGYLDLLVMKQVEEYSQVTQLFDALQRWFHQKKISHVMNTYMRLLHFSMRPVSRIQYHIHAYGDLSVDLQSMGEELSNIKKAMNLFYSLPPSYQRLSKILLHRDNKAVTYNEVVSAILVDEVEQEMLSFSRPLPSSTTLTVIRGQLQPLGHDNLQRTVFKRQRSVRPDIACVK
ncbi:hypothetical protein AXG93_209s1320 [Marchantia polymorpha subsp. ruderalis]|uniref:Uncharacterized protein n=1 Tax=Marchantia polymorpha subsp. ruderalis TaxID=1480154 RepID=A0A176VIX5_MARPO|nr:hypothetical protein AXG93_209s1320 [Marchantia polymorpha subsp. ruderalis]